MWNDQHANIVNQILANAQDDDQHQGSQDAQQNLHEGIPNTSKDKKNFFKDKIEGFLEQVVNKFSSLIEFFSSCNFFHITISVEICKKIFMSTILFLCLIIFEASFAMTIVSNFCSLQKFIIIFFIQKNKK